MAVLEKSNVNAHKTAVAGLDTEHEAEFEQKAAVAASKLALFTPPPGGPLDDLKLIIQSACPEMKVSSVTHTGTTINVVYTRGVSKDKVAALYEKLKNMPGIRVINDTHGAQIRITGVDQNKIGNTVKIIDQKCNNGQFYNSSSTRASGPVREEQGWGDIIPRRATQLQKDFANRISTASAEGLKSQAEIDALVQNFIGEHNLNRGQVNSIVRFALSHITAIERHTVSFVTGPDNTEFYNRCVENYRAADRYFDRYLNPGVYRRQDAVDERRAANQPAPAPAAPERPEAEIRADYLNDPEVQVFLNQHSRFHRFYSEIKTVMDKSGYSDLQLNQDKYNMNDWSSYSNEQKLDFMQAMHADALNLYWLVKKTTANRDVLSSLQKIHTESSTYMTDSVGTTCPEHVNKYFNDYAIGTYEHLRSPNEANKLNNHPFYVFEAYKSMTDALKIAELFTVPHGTIGNMNRFFQSIRTINTDYYNKFRPVHNFLHDNPRIGDMISVPGHMHMDPDALNASIEKQVLELYRDKYIELLNLKSIGANGMASRDFGRHKILTKEIDFLSKLAPCFTIDRAKLNGQVLNYLENKYKELFNSDDGKNISIDEVNRLQKELKLAYKYITFSNEYDYKLDSLAYQSLRKLNHSIIDKLSNDIINYPEGNSDHAKFIENKCRIIAFLQQTQKVWANSDYLSGEVSADVKVSIKYYTYGDRNAQSISQTFDGLSATDYLNFMRAMRDLNNVYNNIPDNVSENSVKTEVDSIKSKYEAMGLDGDLLHHAAESRRYELRRTRSNSRSNGGALPPSDARLFRDDIGGNRVNVGAGPAAVAGNQQVTTTSAGNTTTQTILINHIESDHTRAIEAHLRANGCQAGIVRADALGRLQVYVNTVQEQQAVEAVLQPAVNTERRGPYIRLNINQQFMFDIANGQVAAQAEAEAKAKVEAEKAAEQAKAHAEAEAAAEQARAEARQRHRAAAQAQQGIGLVIPATSLWKAGISVLDGDWRNAGANLKDAAQGGFMAQMHRFVPSTAQRVTRDIVTRANAGTMRPSRAAATGRVYGNVAKKLAERYVSPAGKALILQTAIANIHDACKDKIVSWKCTITAVTQSIDAWGGLHPEPASGLGLNGLATGINTVAKWFNPKLETPNTFFESVYDAVGSTARGDTTPHGVRVPSGAGRKGSRSAAGRSH